MALLLLLPGCSFENMVDSAARSMPVMGERCEHWQCMSAEGRQKSQGVRSSRMPPPQQVQGQPPAQGMVKDEQGYIDPRSAPPLPHKEMDEDADSLDPYGYYTR
jgi:hypothetical protein